MNLIDFVFKFREILATQNQCVQAAIPQLLGREAKGEFIPYYEVCFSGDLCVLSYKCGAAQPCHS